MKKRKKINNICEKMAITKERWEINSLEVIVFSFIFEGICLIFLLDDFD